MVKRMHRKLFITMHMYKHKYILLLCYCFIIYIYIYNTIVLSGLLPNGIFLLLEVVAWWWNGTTVKRFPFLEIRCQGSEVIAVLARYLHAMYQCTFLVLNSRLWAMKILSCDILCDKMFTQTKTSQLPVSVVVVTVFNRRILLHKNS